MQFLNCGSWSEEMVTYSQLKKMKIDLAPLGFDQKGAKILAAAGVDGIH